MGHSTLPRAESSWILPTMPVADRSIAATVFATPLRGGSRVSLPCVRASARGSAASSRHGLAIVDGDEIDVLAKPAVRKMCTRQGGAPDELDPVAEAPAEKCQQMGDEMVALDLFGCDAKLLCDFGAFVNVHAVLRPMLQRGEATP